MLTGAMHFPVSSGLPVPAWFLRNFSRPAFPTILEPGTGKYSAKSHVRSTVRIYDLLHNRRPTLTVVVLL